MSKPCQDSYSINFTSFPLMLAYHEKMRQESRWERTEVNHLTVAPLDKNSPLFGDRTSFAPAVSEDAIRDTADNLGLAIKLGDHYYPLRDTAYKSLLDRAKINGTALPKLSREKLSEVLNSCLALHNKSGALLLIRDEKVAAAHSGDSRDYSILEIDQLLEGLRDKMDARFPDNRFLGGYSDHAITSASWSLPMQKEDLLGAYEKMLESMGKKATASRLTPGIRFSTSDTGMASAKVAALLVGLEHPIHIGSIVAVEHRAPVQDPRLHRELGPAVRPVRRLHRPTHQSADGAAGASGQRHDGHLQKTLLAQEGSFGVHRHV